MARRGSDDLNAILSTQVVELKVKLDAKGSKLPQQVKDISKMLKDQGVEVEIQVKLDTTVKKMNEDMRRIKNLMKTSKTFEPVRLEVEIDVQGAGKHVRNHLEKLNNAISKFNNQYAKNAELIEQSSQKISRSMKSANNTGNVPTGTAGVQNFNNIKQYTKQLERAEEILRSKVPKGQGLFSSIENKDAEGNLRSFVAVLEQTDGKIKKAKYEWNAGKGMFEFMGSNDFDNSQKALDKAMMALNKLQSEIRETGDEAEEFKREYREMMNEAFKGNLTGKQVNEFKSRINDAKAYQRELKQTSDLERKRMAFQHQVAQAIRGTSREHRRLGAEIIRSAKQASDGGLKDLRLEYNKLEDSIGRTRNQEDEYARVRQRQSRMMRQLTTLYTRSVESNDELNKSYIEQTMLLVRNAKSVRDLRIAQERLNNSQQQNENIGHLEKLERKRRELRKQIIDYGTTAGDAYDKIERRIRRVVDAEEHNIRSIDRAINKYKDMNDELKLFDRRARINMEQDNIVPQLSGRKDVADMFAKGDNSGLQKLIADTMELDIRTSKLDTTTGEFRATLNGYGGVVEEVGYKYDRLNNRLIQTSRSTKDNTNANRGLMEQFRIAMERVPIWMGAMTAFYGSIRSVQAMIRELVELDTRLTEIRRVSAEGININQLFEGSIGIAKELGNNVNSVLEGVAEYARTFGDFNERQLLAITRTATLMSNVSDLDAEEATKTLISTMNAFNITAEESIRIVDALNETDNNYAVSTQQLAEGLAKTASVAQTFGVTLEETVGHITAISSTTQESGRLIGNSLKTIYSRITTMGGAVNILESVGVAVKQIGENGEETVRPVTDILNDLSDVWWELSEAEQQNIAVKVAGRYQLSRFLAMMNNYQIAVDATATAITSQGSAMRENQDYLQSFEARFNKLKTTFTELSVAVGDAVLSGAMMQVIGLLAKMAEFGASIANTVGVLPVILGTIGLLIHRFGYLERALRAISISFATTKAQMQSMSNTTTILGRKFTAFGATTRASMVMATMAVRAFSTVVKGVLMSSLVAIPFVLIGMGIEKFVTHLEKGRQKTEEVAKMNEKMISTFRNHDDGMQGMINRYEELSEKASLTTDEQMELNQITAEFAEGLPTTVRYVDANGEAHLKSVDAIRREVDMVKELSQAQAINKKLEFNNTLSTQAENYLDIVDNIEKLYDKQRELNSQGLNYANSEEVQRNRAEIMIAEAEKTQAIENTISTIGEQAIAYIEANGELSKVGDSQQAVIENFVSANDSLLRSAESTEELEDAYNDLYTSANVVGDVFVSAFDALSQGMADGSAEANELRNELGKVAEAIPDSFFKMTDEAGNVIKSQEDIREGLEEIFLVSRDIKLGDASFEELKDQLIEVGYSSEEAEVAVINLARTYRNTELENDGIANSSEEAVDMLGEIETKALEALDAVKELFGYDGGEVGAIKSYLETLDRGLSMQGDAFKETEEYSNIVADLSDRLGVTEEEILNNMDAYYYKLEAMEAIQDMEYGETLEEFFKRNEDLTESEKNAIREIYNTVDSRDALTGKTKENKDEEEKYKDKVKETREEQKKLREEWEKETKNPMKDDIEDVNLELSKSKDLISDNMTWLDFYLEDFKDGFDMKDLLPFDDFVEVYNRLGEKIIDYFKSDNINFFDDIGRWIIRNVKEGFKWATEKGMEVDYSPTALLWSLINFDKDDDGDGWITELGNYIGDKFTKGYEFFLNNWDNPDYSPMALFNKIISFDKDGDGESFVEEFGNWIGRTARNGYNWYLNNGINLDLSPIGLIQKLFSFYSEKSDDGLIAKMGSFIMDIFKKGFSWYSKNGKNLDLSPMGLIEKLINFTFNKEDGGFVPKIGKSIMDMFKDGFNWYVRNGKNLDLSPMGLIEKLFSILKEKSDGEFVKKIGRYIIDMFKKGYTWYVDNGTNLNLSPFGLIGKLFNFDGSGDFKEFSDKIGEYFDELVVKIKEKWDEKWNEVRLKFPIVDKLVEMLPTVEDFQNWWDGIEEWYGEQLEKWNVFWDEFKETPLRAIINMFDQSLENIEKIQVNIIDWLDLKIDTKNEELVTYLGEAKNNLISAISQWWDGFEFNLSGDGLFESINTIFKNLGTTLPTSNGFASVINIGKDLWNKFVGTFDGQSLSDTFKNIIDNIGNWFSNIDLANPFNVSWSDFLESLRSKGTSLMANLGLLWTDPLLFFERLDLWNPFNVSWGKFLENLKGQGTNLVANLIALWSNPIAYIKSLFSSDKKSKDASDSAGRGMVDSVADGAEGEEKNFSDRITKIVTNSIEIVGKIGAVLILAVGTELIKMLGDGAKSMMPQVQNVFISFTNRIISSLEGAVNKFIDGINWLLRKINANEISRLSVGRMNYNSTGSSYGGSRRVSGVQSYAEGTGKEGHSGGMALVGEEGRELAYIPDIGVTMLGQKGAELVNLPKGTSVLPNPDTENVLKSHGFPAYAEGVGDFMGNIGDALLNLLEKPVNFAKDTLKKYMPDSFSRFGELFGNVAKGGFAKLFKEAPNFIKEKMEDSFGSIGNMAGIGGAKVSGSLNNWLITALRLTNTPMSWLPMMQTMAMKESGGNPRAINLWDINAKRGIPSKGLMQTIDPTFNAYKMRGLNDIWNPIHNAVASIRYVKSRYGTIFNTPGARNMARGGGWLGYANGGIVDEMELAWHGEEGAEAIIPLIPKRRKRGIELWRQAGEMLGLLSKPDKSSNSGSVSSGAFGTSSGEGGDSGSGDAGGAGTLVPSVYDGLNTGLFSVSASDDEEMAELYTYNPWERLANQESRGISLLETQMQDMIEYSLEYRDSLQSIIDHERTLIRAYENDLAKQKQRNKEIRRNLQLVKDTGKHTVEQRERYNRLQQELENNVSSIGQLEVNIEKTYQGIAERTSELLENMLNEVVAEFDENLEWATKSIETVDFQEKVLDFTDPDNAEKRKDLLREKAIFNQIKLNEAVEKENVLREEMYKARDKYGVGSAEAEVASKALDEARTNTRQAKLDVLSAEKDIKDFRAEIADDMIENIKGYYEEMKNLAVEAIDTEMEHLEESHDKRMEMFDEEIEKINEIYDAKIEQMDAEQEEEQHQEEMAELNEERAKLQNKLNRLSNDDSLEGRKRFDELQEELDELDEEIAEKREARQDELLREQIQEQKDAQVEAIEQKKENEEIAHEETLTRLEEEKVQIEQKYDDIINDEQRWAEVRKQFIMGNFELLRGELTTVQTQMNNLAENSYLGLTESFKDFSQHTKDTIREMGDTVISDIIHKAQDEINSFYESMRGKQWEFQDGKAYPSDDYKTPNVTTPKTVTSSTSTTEETKEEEKPKKYYRVQKGDTLSHIAKAYYGKASEWRKIAEANGITDPTKLQVNRKLLIPFKDGGFTGNNEGVAYLHKKENVLTEEQTRDIFNTAKLVDKYSRYIPELNRSNFNNKLNNSNINIENKFGDINIHIGDIGNRSSKKVGREVAEEIMNKLGKRG